MVVWLLPLIVLVVCATGEWLHSRCTRRVSHLAFGPAARPRKWVRFVPPARAIAATSVCWGLIELWQNDGGKAVSEDFATNPVSHHLVIALDVSPSMLLSDSGADGKQTRAERARAVLRSILERTQVGGTRVSVVAFYSNALPVVIDTFDPEVIGNIFNDLPLEHAFAPGKTNLYAAVSTAADIAKAWRPRSATFVMVSDGDSLPAAKTPSLPEAFANSLIIGVGNPYQGLPIDGHSSRQESRSLEQLALRLGGTYANANDRHISTATLEQIAAGIAHSDRRNLRLQDVAVWVVLIGSSIIALIGPALALAGSSWSPARARRFEIIDVGIALPSASHTTAVSVQPAFARTAGIGEIR